MFAGLVNGGKVSSRLPITLSRTFSGEGPLIRVVESLASVFLPIKCLKHASVFMYANLIILEFLSPFCFPNVFSPGEERPQMMY